MVMAYGSLLGVPPNVPRVRVFPEAFRNPMTCAGLHSTLQLGFRGLRFRGLGFRV